MRDLARFAFSHLFALLLIKATRLHSIRPLFRLLSLPLAFRFLPSFALAFFSSLHHVAPTSSSICRYGPNPQQLSQSAQGSSFSYAAVVGWMHNVVLTGLQPDSVYAKRFHTPAHFQIIGSLHFLSACQLLSSLSYALSFSPSIDITTPAETPRAASVSNSHSIQLRTSRPLCVCLS